MCCYLLGVLMLKDIVERFNTFKLLCSGFQISCHPVRAVPGVTYPDGHWESPSTNLWLPAMCAVTRIAYGCLQIVGSYSTRLRHVPDMFSPCEGVHGSLILMDIENHTWSYYYYQPDALLLTKTFGYQKLHRDSKSFRPIEPLILMDVDSHDRPNYYVCAVTPKDVWCEKLHHEYKCLCSLSERLPWSLYHDRHCASHLIRYYQLCSVTRKTSWCPELCGLLR